MTMPIEGVIYEGDLKDGTAEGLGRKTTVKSGSVFEGGFEKGVPSGLGALRLSGSCPQSKSALLAPGAAPGGDGTRPLVGEPVMLRPGKAAEGCLQVTPICHTPREPEGAELAAA